MKRVYYDYEQLHQDDASVGLFAPDTEDAAVETVIYAIPMKDKEDRYKWCN